MMLSIPEFKNTILGLRYSNIDEKELDRLYNLFNNEVLKSYDAIRLFQENEIVSDEEIDTESKDQYINPTSSFIIQRPVEIDLSLAYTNTMILLHPNFKNYVKDFLENINCSNQNERKIHKFLLNYTIGNIFKHFPKLSKKVRILVITEVDKFLENHNVEQYVFQKKRDGVVLDLPSTFILGNLKDDPRFKVTEFKSLITNYIDPRKQIYLGRDDKVDLKGIGLVPEGILEIYKKLIHCYLNHGTSDKKSFICIQAVIESFMNKFNMYNFLIPNSKGDLLYTLKLASSEMQIKPENVERVSRGFKTKDVDILYYYKTYIESWVQTIIINSNL